MTRQATLVAAYGPKPAAVARLIAACQQAVADAAATASATAGAAFRPYEAGQVHATIVGLEHAPDLDGDGLNLNFWRHRGQRRAMDVAGYLAHLRASPALPFDVQIAGFDEHRPYPFRSRDRHPHERSFSIQGDRAVVMGWPARAAPPEATAYPATLDDLRRAAQGFGILHAYHRAPADVDNDFYLRLGTFARAPEPDAAAGIARRLRAFLASHPPVLWRVSVADLSVVSYDDDTLPPATSQALPLTAAAAP